MVNNYEQYFRWLVIFWSVSLAGQVAQGAVLLVGIVKIKILISNSGYARMVNNFAFALHFAVFSIYMLLLVIEFSKGFQYFITLKEFSSGTPSNQWLSLFEVQTALSATNFLFQIVLFWVLWRMNSNFSRPRRATNATRNPRATMESSTLRYESEAMFQADELEQRFTEANNKQDLRTTLSPETEGSPNGSMI